MSVILGLGQKVVGTSGKHPEQHYERNGLEAVVWRVKDHCVVVIIAFRVTSFPNDAQHDESKAQELQDDRNQEWKVSSLRVKGHLELSIAVVEYLPDLPKAAQSDHKHDAQEKSLKEVNDERELEDAIVFIFGLLWGALVTIVAQRQAVLRCNNEIDHESSAYHRYSHCFV